MIFFIVLIDPAKFTAKICRIDDHKGNRSAYSHPESLPDEFAPISEELIDTQPPPMLEGLDENIGFYSDLLARDAPEAGSA